MKLYKKNKTLVIVNIWEIACTGLESEPTGYTYAGNAATTCTMITCTSDLIDGITCATGYEGTPALNNPSCGANDGGAATALTLTGCTGNLFSNICT